MFALTPAAYVARFGVGDQRARSLLAAAGFQIEWQTPDWQLSFGQKSRLGLFGLRLSEPNFYLLEEPTNHIDIARQEDLTAEIRDRGAIIDRHRLIEAESPEPFFAPLSRAE